MDVNKLKISREARLRLKEKEEVVEQLVNGTPSYEILGYSDAALEWFYQTSRRFLREERFNDAFDAFIFLTTLNPYNADYWIGLGMAAQMEGDYETAINAYEMAAIVDKGSPAPYLYLAKCLFAMNERRCALEALDLALELTDSSSSGQKLKEEALQVRKQLIELYL